MVATPMGKIRRELGCSKNVVLRFLIQEDRTGGMGTRKEGFMEECRQDSGCLHCLTRFLSTVIVALAFSFPIPSAASDPDEICLMPDDSAIVTIDGCYTGVTNVKDRAGCTIWLRVMQCAGSAEKHSEFLSCVSLAADKFKESGLITAKDKKKIQSCASKADYPCSDCEGGVRMVKGQGFGFERGDDSLSAALRTVYDAYVKAPRPDTDTLMLERQKEAAVSYLQAHSRQAAAALIREASRVASTDSGRNRIILHLMSRFKSDTGIQYLFDRAKGAMPAGCSSGEAGEHVCVSAFSLRMAALAGLGHVSSLGSAPAKSRLLDLVGYEDTQIQRQAIEVFYQTSGISRWRAKRQMADRLPESKRYLLHEIY